MRVVFLALILSAMLSSGVYADDSNISSAVYKHQKTDYSKVTEDPRLIQALDLMIGTSGEFSRSAILGNNLTGKPMKILYKNLSQISHIYASFDALGWKIDDQLYIYINIKHRNAPPEALASLLSHEALHQDVYNSLNEETYAWSLEAKVWLELKEKNPDLKEVKLNEHPLVNRVNTLGELFKNANYTTNKIRQHVETNPGYRDLPKRSPGFDDDN